MFNHLNSLDITFIPNPIGLVEVFFFRFKFGIIVFQALWLDIFGNVNEIITFSRWPHIKINYVQAIIQPSQGSARFYSKTIHESSIRKLDHSMKHYEYYLWGACYLLFSRLALKHIFSHIKMNSLTRTTRIANNKSPREYPYCRFYFQFIIVVFIWFFDAHQLIWSISCMKCEMLSSYFDAQ